MNKISVIIPAAGKATRMRPLSNSISKAMIPVNGKPIISYIIEHLFKISIPNEIVIVQNELQDIENFVKNAYPSYYENGIIKFVRQENPEGPLHAIKLGNEKLNRNNRLAFDRPNEDNYPVMIWLGDTICLESNFDLNKNFLVTFF
jgi:NDP-sugar pyrophosphorylase family protein